MLAYLLQSTFVDDIEMPVLGLVVYLVLRGI
jgi:hypothetical protein